MFRRVFTLLGLAVFAASLSGCVTSGAYRQKDLENQGLKSQVSTLEAQVQSKDEEISGLKEELIKISEQKTETPVAGVQEAQALQKSERPTVKEVQTALKNAGFYTGNIDGHKGKKTRSGLKAFQRAHNLTPTGKANKKTWAILSEYLTQKAK